MLQNAASVAVALFAFCYLIVIPDVVTPIGSSMWKQHTSPPPCAGDVCVCPGQVQQFLCDQWWNSGWVKAKNLLGTAVVHVTYECAFLAPHVLHPVDLYLLD